MMCRAILVGTLCLLGPAVAVSEGHYFRRELEEIKYKVGDACTTAQVECGMWTSLQCCDSSATIEAGQCYDPATQFCINGASSSRRTTGQACATSEACNGYCASGTDICTGVKGGPITWGNATNPCNPKMYSASNGHGGNFPDSCYTVEAGCEDAVCAAYAADGGSCGNSEQCRGSCKDAKEIAVGATGHDKYGGYMVCSHDYDCGEGSECLQVLSAAATGLLAGLGMIIIIPILLGVLCCCCCLFFIVKSNSKSKVSGAPSVVVATS